MARARDGTNWHGWDGKDGRADVTADGTPNEDAQFCFLMISARRGRCAEDPNWDRESLSYGLRLYCLHKG